MEMKTYPENLAYWCVVNLEQRQAIWTWEVDLDAISIVSPPECPSWFLQQPKLLFNLSDLRKGDPCPLVFQSMLLELFCGFPRHLKVYTDESKEDKRTAMSFVCVLNLAVV